MEKYNIRKKARGNPHKLKGIGIVRKFQIFDGTGRNVSSETKIMQIYMPGNLIYKILGEKCAQYNWCWFLKVC